MPLESLIWGAENFPKNSPPILGGGGSHTWVTRSSHLGYPRTPFFSVPWNPHLGYPRLTLSLPSSPTPRLPASPKTHTWVTRQFQHSFSQVPSATHLGYPELTPRLPSSQGSFLFHQVPQLSHLAYPRVPSLQPLRTCPETRPLVL